MKRILALALLTTVPLGAAAQAVPDDGMRLFNQSCRVCHTKPQLTSQQYAPVLSRVSMNGNDDALRKQIADGSPKMPGFKYHFKPHEIDALVAYLKTVPPPAD